MKHTNRFKYFSSGLISGWLILFALLPFSLLLLASFLHYDPDKLFTYHFTLNNYRELFTIIYAKVFIRSLLIAAMVTAICLIIAFPFAYLLSRMQSHYKSLLLLLILVPLWTSSLIRTYAIIAILKAKGLLSGLLITLGLIHQPLNILYTNTAVIIGLVYNLLPFMILPLYANLERFDLRLLEAAQDLGATRWVIFKQVIIPNTKAGIIAGCILVLLPAMTIFYIPGILGGAKSMLLGNLIQEQFLVSRNWPLGAATSVILTILMGMLIIFYWRNAKASDRQDLV